MFFRSITIAFLSLPLACYGDFENRLENGDFDEPKVATAQTFFAPSNKIIGWELIEGSVDLIPAETWPYSRQLIDLTGDSPGVLEQTIETTPGGRYRLRFRYVNHPGTAEEVSARLEIFSPVTSQVDDLFAYSGWTGAAPNEAGFYQSEFIADANEMTVRLSAEAQDNGLGLLVRSIFIRRVLIGDMNCDEAVNLLDVADFVNCVANCSYNETADINQDGSVNLLDVPAFIELLIKSS